MKKILFPLLALVLLLSLALPMPAMAWTKWDLEGWRQAQGKWMDGLLWTYYECNWVPYRLVANKYDGLDTNISIQLDYLDANGHYGIDGARNFFIGPKTGRKDTPEDIYLSRIYEAGVDYGPGVGVVFDVIQPPTVVPVSNGSMLEYQFIVINSAALTELKNFAFYWEAHCARTNSVDVTFGNSVEFGASFWSGASLHTHTSVTGNQDVPIKTPPQISEPSIDVEKYVGISCLSEPDIWYDADEIPFPQVWQCACVWFKYVVTNNGDVTLANVELSDDTLPTVSTPPGYETLAPGDYFEVVFGPFYVIVVGQHTNIATVTGEYGTYTCQDTDSANYLVLP